MFNFWHITDRKISPLDDFAIYTIHAIVLISNYETHEKGTTVIFSYIRTQVSKHTVTQNSPTRMTQSRVRPISGSFH